VLPLVNNWPDYGGMQQYVAWFLGLPDDSYGAAVNHDRFYTDPRIREAYRAWAQHVTHHRNPYAGLRYNEDPTIMTFELANQPRCRSDKSGRTLLAWADEMSRWLKRRAPHQLVAVGDEGFFGTAGDADYPYSDYEGASFSRLTALPAVDYGTFHLYPQGWGENPQSKPGTDPVSWGTTWIERHAAEGRRLGKPVVLEEYGLAVDAAVAWTTRRHGTPPTPAGRRRSRRPALRVTSSGSSRHAPTTAACTATTTATAWSTPAAPPRC
jgi:mannan endo-1,4-beta-mannosidase